MHCLIGIKQRSQNRTIVPISASIGESKTSESDPLSGRAVPVIHQDNPKWHTREKNRPFRLPNRGLQCAKMGILRTGQDAILGVVRLDFLSSAGELRANAVIGVDLKYSEFSGGGKSMLFVVATGTAVIVKIRPE
ncbi:MAG: heavy metal-binding domain-containing protein [Rhodoferax sp.]|nr:heavy metal-binding domain-containing protein [Rhodoferax sp.]